MGFEGGQIVRLKSGGPPMVVIDVLREDGQLPLVDCGWFTHQGEYQEQEFVEYELWPCQWNEEECGIRWWDHYATFIRGLRE